MIVLDASVLLKWFVEEEGQSRALSYRQRHLEGKEVIALPELAFYEIANVFVARTKLSALEIKGNIHQLLAYGFEVASFAELPGIVEVARRYQVTIYDAAYAALAKLLKCPFVTADGRLAKKLHGSHSIRMLASD